MLSADPWQRYVRIAGVANLLVGAFLVAWPLLLKFPPEDDALKRCFVVIGALAAVCGGARAFLPSRNWVLSSANLVFGFWILLAPLEFQQPMPWRMIVATAAGGLALMAFSWWSLSETLEGRRFGPP